MAYADLAARLLRFLRATSPEPVAPAPVYDDETQYVLNFLKANPLPARPTESPQEIMLSICAAVAKDEGTVLVDNVDEVIVQFFAANAAAARADSRVRGSFTERQMRQRSRLHVGPRRLDRRPAGRRRTSRRVVRHAAHGPPGRRSGDDPPGEHVGHGRPSLIGRAS